MKPFPTATLVVCLATGVFAQSSTSGLTGSVSDATGARIAAAAIEITNSGTGFSRRTEADGEGRYAFANLPPGAYALRATHPGFTSVEIPIEIRVGTNSVRNVVFTSVEGVAESVQVEADAAGVNMSDSSLGNAFGTRAVLQLPLSARNAAGLLSLQSGVTFVSDDPNDVRFRDNRNGSVNGSRADQGNVTLDGVDVNDQQNRTAFTSVLRNTLDSIQEFRVVTSGARAEYGRSSGAQIALVTKSGSNEVHGSAYHFHRNTITSANDFFNNRAGVARPKLIRNMFGASLGGPIKRNKLFLFGNYEGRRDASEASVVRVVPDANVRQGIIRYRTESGTISQVGPEQLRQFDPLGLGASPAVLDFLRTYPVANDNSV
jgi:hypothetical protein